MYLSSKEIVETVVKMASQVEKVVKNCLNKDVDLDDIFSIENNINEFHKIIDEECFKYIALKSPQARDLRLALAAMKINSELERIGDQATSVKRYAENLEKKYSRLEAMNLAAQKMLSRAIDSFIHSNIEEAQKVIVADSEINDLNQNVIEEFLLAMKNNEISFEEGYSVIRIAKNIERIGDHCTNIAEDVIFAEEGKDIRHDPDIKKDRKKDNRLDDFLKKIDKS
ncbi:MAG: phosphate signaling complex protein PhoU [Oligoflexia bacterium]|nr:phosphate signaling complex protein PhoU [Oligoflexia bacterium]